MCLYWWIKAMFITLHTIKNVFITIPNSNYLHCIQYDQLIISTLNIYFFFNDVLIDYQTSRSIWTTLESALAFSLITWVMSLHSSPFDLWQVFEESISTYLHRGKAYNDELTIVGKPLNLTNFNLNIYSKIYYQSSRT